MPVGWAPKAHAWGRWDAEAMPTCGLPEKNKGLAEAKPKFLLVGRVGIEPTTNGLRDGFAPTERLVNPMLAALANLETCVIQSQLRHSQSGEGAIGRHRSFSPEFESQDAVRVKVVVAPPAQRSLRSHSSAQEPDDANTRAAANDA